MTVQDLYDALKHELELSPDKAGNEVKVVFQTRPAGKSETGLQNVTCGNLDAFELYAEGDEDHPVFWDIVYYDIMKAKMKRLKKDRRAFARVLQLMSREYE